MIIETFMSFFRKEEIRHPEAVDWLYFGLWIFTHIYLALVAIFYFARLTDLFPRAPIFFGSFDEPYLGAVATYTILKEIRKKRGVRRHHHGGIFVIYWLILFTVSILLAWRSPLYRFDDLLHIMLTNALATSVIWMGSFIHKP